MKKVILGTFVLLVFCTFQLQAQDKIIKSKYGLTVYPVTATNNPITIYPNPAASLVSFKSLKPLAGFCLEVFDESGLTCAKQERWSGEALDVSKLQAGIYIVRFTKGRDRYSQKLVVHKDQLGK